MSDPHEPHEPRHARKCDTCQGEKEIKQPFHDPDTATITARTIPCPACEGTGRA
jgi:DnaJ-class molecular chaperone